MTKLNLTPMTVTAAATALVAALAQATPAEAGIKNICMDTQLGHVCLDAGTGNIGFVPVEQDHVKKVQYAHQLQSGSYFGTWKDGTNMVERIVVKNGYLTMQRIAGGHGNGQSGPIVKFFQTGASEYTNQNGSKIFVASPTTMTWRNKNDQNHVFYHLMH